MEDAGPVNAGRGQQSGAFFSPWQRAIPFDRGAKARLIQVMAKNVLGGDLQVCSMDPVTGFFRDGCCHTSKEDGGMHTVCAVMTEDFLVYSKSMGNDLTKARLEFQFPGLKAGDRWCVCLGRWVEALDAGFAPPVVLEATHASVCEFIDRDVLEAHAWPSGGRSGTS